MARRQTIDDFHRLFYNSWLQTWVNTSWLGIPSEKPSHDLWIYQEIITELRPDVIVETGTRYGGSALFMATICDALGHGQVVTIDLQPLASGERSRPAHSRVTYLTGSSTSPEILAQVAEMTKGKGTVMVILDSDHSMTHVSDELRLYSPFVTEGSYLIVEDTHLNGHPVEPDFGPGPREALQVFLAATPEFSPDRGREKFLLTFNPGGYLRRWSADSTGGRLRTAEADLAVRQDEVAALKSELSETRAEADEQRRRADAVVDTVEQSASWRLTAPLRRLGEFLASKRP